MLEEKQRQKRQQSAGVRAHSVLSSFNSQKNIVPYTPETSVSYDTTLTSLDVESEAVTPTVVTVQAPVQAKTPPKKKEIPESSSANDISEKLQKADLSQCVASDEEEGAVDPWKEDIEEHTLPCEAQPDIHEANTNLIKFVMDSIFGS
ncbi:unnamed protein product [Caenorhabditis auriculariae]|uniref:Uncharacterized protein n=1 Tax=Caenorhabditis auriculariae TaxID=2777116 RepID=A0A8S1H8N7_9PELO|nr:unnamed protein product [Caenorhabditis auriculariae]